MFTVDMSKCPGCAVKEKCTNRKHITKTLSKLSGELNEDPFIDGPGDGLIIVHCQYKPTEADSALPAT